MNNNQILWRVALLWLGIGAAFPAIWYLALSIYGWRRSESFSYSPQRKAIYWDRARFRHASAVLTFLIAAGVGALGWWLLTDVPRWSFCAGVLLSYLLPFPGQLLVIAFKLYGIFPNSGSGGSGPGAHGMRRTSGGRDP